MINISMSLARFKFKYIILTCGDKKRQIERERRKVVLNFRQYNSSTKLLKISEKGSHKRIIIT